MADNPDTFGGQPSDVTIHEAQVGVSGKGKNSILVDSTGEAAQRRRKPKDKEEDKKEDISRTMIDSAGEAAQRRRKPKDDKDNK
ncbi:hypothetical protein FALBO_3025 [Fusarium albosuccineum]|uniref:Uncharacterized protein n=1 Tax=Fusarium albosuccineum TaxID=1237068 RepID=A0A8H4LI79_9HYPO|nr:hypothetical protein FALBO_3025 [Fusarium albosuccineum]